MSIEELTKLVEASVGTQTQQESFDFLLKAKIIGEDGYLHPDYFHPDDLDANREQGKPIKKS